MPRNWGWSADQTALTFKLRDGVRWHDGKPFNSADVKCTCDLLLGKAADKFRVKLRAGWYTNLADVTTSGDREVAFHLKRPQSSILALLASGYTPIYPCHVPAAMQRTNPTGVCEITTMNGTANLLVNRDASPFNDPRVRQATALTLDRKVFIDIRSEGQSSIERGDQVAQRQFTADRRRSADADRLRGDQHTFRVQVVREGAEAYALLPDAVLVGDDQVLEEHHVRTTDRRPPDAMTAVSDPRDQTEARDRRAHIAPRPASATPSSAREAGSGASLTVLEVRDCDSANGVPTVDVDAI